ncbi:MAG: helix-turn-helix transcriptional regulator [Pirellulaceae bacterium]
MDSKTNCPSSTPNSGNAQSDNPRVNSILRESLDVGRPDTNGLSERQRQVLALLLTGQSERELATHLSLSTGTIHKYVTQIYRHFGVSTRAELMALWINRPRRGFKWEPRL